MKRALILHGTAATPDDNWFRWLESHLVESGYAVWLPQLPGAATPTATVYDEFILGNSDFTIDAGTIIIGHSSGAVEILSLLQHLPDNVTAADVYLVSAFKDNLDWGALDGLFMQPYDYELIKTKARSITLIHSDDDPYVPLDHAQYLAAVLSVRLLILPGQGHFNTEKTQAYKQFPALLQVIESQDN